MKRLVRLTSVLAAALLLTTCTELWGPLDSPYDEAGEDYQGYPTVPTADQITAVTTGEFTWVPELVAAEVVGASAYEFQVAESSDVASSVVWEISTNTNIVQPGKDGLLAGSYWWRARATTGGETGPWTSVTRFSVLSSIIAMEPADGEKVSDTTPTLDWDDVDGASAYDVQVSTSKAAVSAAALLAADTSSYDYPTALSDGDRLYWRVRARNGEAVGGWSPVADLVYRPYLVGETGPAGGVVIYDKGGYSDGWCFLEVAPEDQSSGAEWGGDGTDINGANAGLAPELTAIGTGAANTQAIVDALGAGTYAARICYDLSLGGYDDWFLPSRDELDAVWDARDLVGGLPEEGGGYANDYYWTSSEIDDYMAWFQLFDDGYQSEIGKVFNYRVRAIRAF